MEDGVGSGRDLSPAASGRSDVGDRFLLPQRLYGRERQLAQLLEAFEQVGAGPSQFLLVSGYAGVGKTSLIRELYRPLGGPAWTLHRREVRPGRQCTVRGPAPGLPGADPADPHGGRGAGGRLAEPADRGSGHMARACSPRWFPSSASLLGPQPRAPALGATETQNRFRLVIRNLLRILARREHPLVVFLDDLQWADSATLNLLEPLLSDGEIEALLLIGAYRDREIGPAHPLTRALDPAGGGRRGHGARGAGAPRAAPISRAWFATPCIATSRPPSRWPAWCPRRPAAIRSSSGSSSRRFARRSSSASTTSGSGGRSRWTPSPGRDDRQRHRPDDPEDPAALARHPARPDAGVVHRQSVRPAHPRHRQRAIARGRRRRIWRTRSRRAWSSATAPGHRVRLSARPGPAIGLRADSRPSRSGWCTSTVGRLLQSGSERDQGDERLFDIVHHLNLGRGLHRRPGRAAGARPPQPERRAEGQVRHAHEAALGYLTAGLEMVGDELWQPGLRSRLYPAPRGRRVASTCAGTIAVAEQQFRGAAPARREQPGQGQGLSPAGPAVREHVALRATRWRRPGNASGSSACRFRTPRRSVRRRSRGRWLPSDRCWDSDPSPRWPISRS